LKKERKRGLPLFTLPMPHSYSYPIFPRKPFQFF
jgi:hypothetical protein